MAILVHGWMFEKINGRQKNNYENSIE